MLLYIFVGSLLPYIETLDSWLFQGTLDDPFDEVNPFQFFCSGVYCWSFEVRNSDCLFFFYLMISFHIYNTCTFLPYWGTARSLAFSVIFHFLNLLLKSLYLDIHDPLLKLLDILWSIADINMPCLCAWVMSLFAFIVCYGTWNLIVVSLFFLCDLNSMLYINSEACLVVDRVLLIVHPSLWI